MALTRLGGFILLLLLKLVKETSVKPERKEENYSLTGAELSRPGAAVSATTGSGWGPSFGFPFIR